MGNFGVSNSKPVPAICWVVALRSEAQPLIKLFGMRLVSNQMLFPIFKNEELGHCLVLSGVGQVNVAAATTFLAGVMGAARWTAWINVGIAGYFEEPVGQFFQVNKVVQSSTGRKLFPGFRFAKMVSFRELSTLDVASRNYRAGILFDMEGFAFADIASRLCCNELTFLFKIVSDTPQSCLGDFDENFVSGLIEKNLQNLSAISGEVLKLVSVERERLDLPFELKEVLSFHQFSATAEKQVIEKYRIWKIKNKDRKFSELISGLKTARAILAKLKFVTS